MTAAGSPRAVRVRISGRVQGVWYRAWTVEQAVARGLSGWVRNRADGSVEAVFVGDGSQVDAMLAACHQGPSAARVDDVSVTEEPRPPTEPGFHQKPTA
jgi:acylphosphatase